MQRTTNTGILVPGGFGNRGIEGMIEAARFARTKKVPYFGICLGMQVRCACSLARLRLLEPGLAWFLTYLLRSPQIAVIEYARSFLGHKNATSEEFDQEAEHKIIIFMPEGSTTHMVRLLSLSIGC